MMEELAIQRWRDDLAAALEFWREPDGMLVFSERDPEVRERCRDRLRVAVEVLDRVLGGNFRPGAKLGRIT
jgi:hypothetical protein